MIRRAIVALSVLLVASGCGASTGLRDEGDLRQADPPPNQNAPKVSVNVFLLQYGQVLSVTRRVASGGSLARAALEQLLQGPTSAEESRRYTTAIPQGVELGDFVLGPNSSVSVTLVGSALETVVANQNVSSGPSARQRQLLLQQIVYTLQEFPTITLVEVSLNASPIPLDAATRSRPLFKAMFATVPPLELATACGAATPPVKLPKDAHELRLTDPKPDSAIETATLHFAGETTVAKGAIVVRLIQDGHVLASIDAQRGAYNQPAAGGGSRPCGRFEGALEIPWGVTGDAMLQVAVEPGPGAGPSRVVAPTITIGAAPPS